MAEIKTTHTAATTIRTRDSAWMMRELTSAQLIERIKRDQRDPRPSWRIAR
jgi:hypothetical protein